MKIYNSDSSPLNFNRPIRLKLQYMLPQQQFIGCTDQLELKTSIKFKENGDDKRNQHEAGVFQKNRIDYSYGGV
jgi:hypothetical protein